MVRRFLVLIIGAVVAMASASGTEAVLPSTIDIAASAQNYTIIGGEAGDSVGGASRRVTSTVTASTTS